MTTQNTCCTLAPYFKVADGQLDAFKVLCEKLVEKTKNEAGCLYYNFTFNGNIAHAQESYQSAESILEHLENAGDLLGEALKICEIVRLELHGPEAELEKLREPLAHLKPTFFIYECGFRR